MPGPVERGTAGLPMRDLRSSRAVAMLVLLPTVVLLGALLAPSISPAGVRAPLGPTVASGSPAGVPGCQDVTVAAVFVLDNASPETCFWFGPSPVAPTNVSLRWVAFPDPAVVRVTLGPAVPFGAVACPLFVAELYTGNGTSGSASWGVARLPPGSTSGCLWPYRLSASSNASGGLAPGETVVAALMPAAALVPTCVPSAPVVVNNTSYGACWATLDGAVVQGTAPAKLLAVTFDGVQFTVEGYATADCSVVNVTGVEPSGARYTLLLYPASLDCRFTQPTVLSPDGVFGASWSGGPSIELLVRS
jgi:hypothetical protein